MKDEKVPHVNLMICTPGHSMMGSYVKSLINLIAELNNKNITWGFASDYSSHVADAREITLSGTKQNSLTERRPFEGKITYDKLMWIDSDIAWEPEDVIALYNSDKDIISGAYLLANGEVTAYAEKLGSPYKYEEVIKMKEPLKVGGVGFGFVCVKSGVFESLSRPWFQSAITTTEFEGEENYTFAMIGEDLSWCYRVKEQGYEIWFNPNVRVTHHKMMKLTWEGIQP
jgi:hypothetical protein